MQTAQPISQAARPRPSWGRRLGRALLYLLLVLVLLAVAGAVYQAVAAARDRAAAPPGQLVDIGGRRIHLLAAGMEQPGPTVVLIACSGCTSANWGWVQTGVAAFAPTVAVDRAGLGWSDPSAGPHDAATEAADLHAALQAADAPGPYVLAGHSFGGPVARVYAAAYPDEVAGLVFADPRDPDQSSRFPAELAQSDQESRAMIRTLALLNRAGLLRLAGIGAGLAADLPESSRAAYSTAYYRQSFWDTLGEQSSAIEATDAQARAAGPLGDRPLVVVSAGAPFLRDDEVGRAARAAWLELHAEQAALSTRGEHRTVQAAGHEGLVNVEEYAAEVVRAIRDVVEEVRGE